MVDQGRAAAHDLELSHAGHQPSYRATVQQLTRQGSHPPRHTWRAKALPSAARKVSAAARTSAPPRSAERRTRAARRPRSARRIPDTPASCGARAPSDHCRAKRDVGPTVRSGTLPAAYYGAAARTGQDHAGHALGTNCRIGPEVLRLSKRYARPAMTPARCDSTSGSSRGGRCQPHALPRPALNAAFPACPSQAKAVATAALPTA